MDWYLKKMCECGGDVCVITSPERDKYTNKKITIVSHGACISCNNTIIFPNDVLSDFLSCFSSSEKYRL